ncbi:MAG: nuclear transport factor 2 family protein [Myxococcales bacterium]|nr:nuclear transport factor 2 family protein [Myxococcales bacterium]
MFALVLLAGGTAGAEAQKAKDAAVGARAALDKADEAWNAHDAKALAAMLDKTFFGSGPTVSAKFDTAEAMATHLEAMAAKGGRITRDALTIKPDEDGNSAWYIADYTFVPKVPPGALPVHRKLRESGVLVKRGKEWKIAMTHMSLVQQDESAPLAPPSTAAPMKK